MSSQNLNFWFLKIIKTHDILLHETQFARDPRQFGPDSRPALIWHSNNGLEKTRFRKAPFSGRISFDGRPNRTNKVAFSNFSCRIVHEAFNFECKPDFCLGVEENIYIFQVE